jgi:hypothetical protein
MKTAIDEAIYAHSRWKTRLKNIIHSGESDVPLLIIGNPHECQFGKWLDSDKDAKKSSYYSQVNKLHTEFHEEASEVAKLALSGLAREANEKMEMGSKFSELSAKLVNILAEWKGSL